MSFLNKISEKLVSKFTNKFTDIPLFYVTFNYQKFLKDGAKGSCDIKYHPDFENDEELKNMMFNIIDYIRNNYDMKNFTKI